LASGQYHFASAGPLILALGLLCLLCPSRVFLATGQTVWGFRVSCFRFLDFQSRIYRAHGSKFNRCATAKFMKLLGLGNKVWGTGWAASVCPTPVLLNPGKLRNCTVVSRHLSGAWQAVAGRVSWSIGHSLLQASGFIGSGLPGSFVPTLMFLMVRVARGILRFILENTQGFRRLPPNKSFQGTPLRSAPELSR